MPRTCQYRPPRNTKNKNYFFGQHPQSEWSKGEGEDSNDFVEKKLDRVALFELYSYYFFIALYTQNKRIAMTVPVV